ncbi:MAG: AAA family ATPase, partial [Chloroflexota bacterium]
MTPINPYVAGNPIGNTAAFVGREGLLREVLQVLRRPQDNAIVLYGQRRIGKTSILQELAVRLSAEGPYRTVYCDLQDKAALPLGRVLTDLALTIAYSLGQPDPDLGANPEATFRESWLPAVLAELPTEVSLVLLFDEFDVLADPQTEQAAAAFFPYLRQLFTSEPRRLKFVFVIGRNVNDLGNIALSLFKGAPAQRVSLLNHEEAGALIRLSEVNQTLYWSDEAVETVWALTHGHPFLVQQLCSRVWERAYGAEPAEPPTVSPSAVEVAVPDALEASRNTMEWIWDGLPPAERVVIAALAAAGPGSISQEGLERVLQESGVRVVIRELQNAPQLLQDWDLIEPSNGGYSFRVELLRRWLVEHRPLNRVQEELDRIEPVAENLYRAALGFYKGRKFSQATALLRQTISLNPNHVQANQLLAELLLSRGVVEEALQLLERLYEYQPAAARPRLVQALLLQAQATSDESTQLAYYDRVLAVDPRQPEAVAGRQRIWRARAEAALQQNDLPTALNAWQEAGLVEKAAEVSAELRRRELADTLQHAKQLEREKQYQAALELIRQLAQLYPEERPWPPEIERLEAEAGLADKYQRGLGALRSEDRPVAKALLAQVAALEPDYEEVTRYLHQAVTGIDVAAVQEEMKLAVKAYGQIKRLRLMVGFLVTVLLVALLFSDAGLGRSTPTDADVTLTALIASLGTSPPTPVPTDTPTPTPTVTPGPTPTPPVTSLPPQAFPSFAGPVPTGAVARLGKGQVNGLALSSDGDYLAVASSVGVYVYEAYTLAEIWSSSTEDWVLSVALSPDGDILASGLGNNTVILWDVATGQILTTLRELAGEVWEIAFSAEGDILATGSDDGSILLWDVASGQLIRKLPGHPAWVRSVAFSPDGRLLASGSLDMRARLWDVASGELLYTLPGHTEAVHSVAFAPDGQTLATGSWDGTVRLWNVADGQAQRTLTGHSQAVRHVTFSPDGGTLASASDDSTIILWDVVSGNQQGILLGHQGRVWNTAFYPGSDILASASEDDTVLFWNWRTGEPLRTLQGHTAAVNSIAFADDDTLAAAADDNTVVLWEVSVERPRNILLGHAGVVRGVAFSPDGQVLTSGAADGSILLWNTNDGELLRGLAGHTSSVNSIAFSPDGQTLASGSDDNT